MTEEEHQDWVKQVTQPWPESMMKAAAAPRPAGANIATGLWYVDTSPAQEKWMTGACCWRMSTSGRRKVAGAAQAARRSGL